MENLLIFILICYSVVGFCIGIGAWSDNLWPASKVWKTVLFTICMGPLFFAASILMVFLFAPYYLLLVRDKDKQQRRRT